MSELDHERRATAYWAKLAAMTPEERIAEWQSHYEPASDVFAIEVRREKERLEPSTGLVVAEPVPPVVALYPPGDDYYTATFQGRAEVEAFCAELIAAADEAWP
jgi:hypothetical protein